MNNTETAYEKGKSYEQHVAKLLRRKIDKGAMRNKGSHASDVRRSDVFTNLPLHIEAKHHESIRLKDWIKQAEGAKSAYQTAVVAFRMDEEDYACLKLNDLLDLFVQILDNQTEIEYLRKPVQMQNSDKTPESSVGKLSNNAHVADDAEQAVARARKAKVDSGSAICRNGHLTDNYGYCMDKHCVYRRGGYKANKKREGKKSWKKKQKA